MSTTSNNPKLNGNVNSTQQSKHQHASNLQPPQNHHTVQHSAQNPSSAHTGSHSQHIVPPRYQPPPQPPGGILKHLPVPKSSIPSYFPGDAVNHLNIKYPPEVPKLQTVFIPDRANANPSRIVPPRSSQPHRQLPPSGPPSSHLPQPVRSGEDERLNGPSQEMLKFVRKSDGDPTTVTNPNASTATVRLPPEQNRHFQSLIAELRQMKEANQRLSDDNQELRDLCCFLDDDRQKGRKLAREWQRFGRYTASVMRQEVSAYQNKLRQLDDKQQELIRDNLELKELCLYLDEERANVAASISSCTNCGATMRGNLRDDGDGSSSSTNDEPMPSELNLRPSLSDQTMQYVRSLERRIRQLEHEHMAAVTTAAATVNDTMVNATSQNNSQTTNTSSDQIASNRPEAVVRALQILEVREQLERDRNAHASISPEHLDDGEKALVREMCNVVWRKLEENGPGLDPI